MIGYELVDMFATRPYAGSPLAVVPRADGLSTATMRAVARELNTTETAFVLPPGSSGASYRVRVFTPAGESPYGGHSALGTAVTLTRLGLVPPGPVVQECGPRRLTVETAADRGTVRARDPLTGVRIDLSRLAAAAGVAPADIAAETGDTAGFGPLFHYLPVRPGAVAAARPDLDLMREHGLADVLVFSWDRDTRSGDARLFAPGYGIPEDPACGPVALGLGPWLVAAGHLPDTDGVHRYELRQGVGTDREATLHGTVEVAGGRVVAASVTGQVHAVGRGELVPGPDPGED